MEKIYLDHSSCTPAHPLVVEAMVDAIRNTYGNPSNLHHFGQVAGKAVTTARGEVASLIGAKAEEIIFTSSGSEANNFAIRGLATANKKKGKHIITSEIEHFSILNPLKKLRKMGFEVTHVPVDKYGMIDPEDVAKAITPETALVSIMHANSEIGTIEPIEEIGKIVKEKGITFHVDAVASAGYIPVDVDAMMADAISLAGSQFYGPKGAGALYLRKGVRIMPLLDGGIQEGGRRAGTENIPAIIGLGKAAELAGLNMVARTQQLTQLRDHLLKNLPEKIKRVIVTGHPRNRLPGNASCCVEFIEGESMLMMLNSKGIAISSGSACTSRALKASHVLITMGLPHEIAQGSILFTLGIDNTLEDIDYILEVMPPIVDRLRQMSPLYSKFSKGGS